MEEEPFIKYTKMLNSEARIPSRFTIRRDIEETYRTKKEEIKRKLMVSLILHLSHFVLIKLYGFKEMPGKLSFFVDCWTSSNQKAFQGVIVQGITTAWELFTIPLDLTLLDGPHTGENLADAFMTVLQDFNLEEKLHSVTTDNASNMDTFVEFLKDKLNEKVSQTIILYLPSGNITIHYNEI